MVLYFILLENLPSLCNSILPPTYWGTLSKTVEDLTTEKVATELIFLLARSVSSATPERYDFAQWEWWKHDTCDLWHWQNGWFLTLVVHKPEKKKRREMLTSLQTLRDIHVCSTGLYKLSQKGLWSDTSPWCSLSERARTLIYNSLLVTRLTPTFFFFFLQKGTPAVSAVTC